MQKMWPVSDELLDEMQSLQIDAVAENRSNAQAGKTFTNTSLFCVFCQR